MGSHVMFQHVSIVQCSNQSELTFSILLFSWLLLRKEATILPDSLKCLGGMEICPS
jgi:hypothetical protein